ncbi:acidic fibroblast growth factor intracellular-binding protein B-like [Lytechinus variegatus]|uniref:acidic fibroblast growth factor intracellular-binding protein B-like n=1 Tax=Lytechinus variegatus TaxID=7654 RepID=UPI001BB1D2EB|nr:acidic fibroblast growth factor intracellular-binding protein B-like [Lytechinus variegatus]
MSETMVNIVVGNITMVDPEVYRYWLDGYSAYEAARRRHQKVNREKPGYSFEIIKNDTDDNYRAFIAMEKHLQNPLTLANQPLFQLPPDMQGFLIENFYELDSSVAREILGKKLSSRHRKDLDEIRDKTNVALRSCRRQYDNFKRVFKTVEDMEGPMVKNIQNHFLLSQELAKKYAAIVFFANNRFETGKKRVQYLTFNDLAYCADEMISSWTAGSVDSRKEDLDADFDREFLQMLRELKFLAYDKDASDQHRTLVCNSIKGKITDRAYSDIEGDFKTVSRAIISIACGMIHSKELRDFFNDVIEKIVEPCRQSFWTADDMSKFLTVYTSSSYQVEAMGRHPRLHSTLERYMSTLRKCVIRMYHS